jgi:hypothetical protein
MTPDEIRLQIVRDLMAHRRVTSESEAAQLLDIATPLADWALSGRRRKDIAELDKQLEKVFPGELVGAVEPALFGLHDPVEHECDKPLAGERRVVGSGLSNDSHGEVSVSGVATETVKRGAGAVTAAPAPPAFGVADLERQGENA